MKVSTAFVMVLLVTVTGCADLATAKFNKESTVGRDVDVVISELQKNGIACSSKALVKGFSGRMVGAVNCGVKSGGVICPESRGVYLTYDSDSNKVIAISKDKRTNCF